jgi:hypothetical protein
MLQEQQEQEQATLMNRGELFGGGGKSVNKGKTQEEIDERRKAQRRSRAAVWKDDVNPRRNKRNKDRADASKVNIKTFS